MSYHIILGKHFTTSQKLSTEPVKTRQRAGITKREKLIVKILQSECIKFTTIFFPIKLLKVNGFVCLLGSRINLV